MRDSSALKVCALLPILVLGQLAISTASSPLGASAAYRVTIDRSLVWVNSGAWNQDETILYLADAVGKEIVPFSLTGAPREDLRRSATDLGLGGFSWIQSIDGGYVLEGDPDGTMIFLDWQFNRLPPAPVSLVSQVADGASQARDQLGAVYAWTFAGSEFFVFGDLRQSLPAWASGFLRVPRDTPDEFRSLLDLRISLGDPLRVFYRLGMNLFAADGDHSYLLVMELAPYILNIANSEVLTLEGLPSHCAMRPDIPQPREPADSVRVFRALETSSGPVGLYAFSGKLYILCRRVDDQGRKWSLARVDPDNGNEVSVIPLDTDADNLTVIPGVSRWAFVEKGPVQSVEPTGFPFFDIESILFVDSGAIEAARPARARPAVSEAAAPQTPQPSFLEKHVPWVFSGIGVFILGLGVSLAVWIRARRRRSDSPAVDTQRLRS